MVGLLLIVLRSDSAPAGKFPLPPDVQAQGATAGRRKTHPVRIVVFV